MSFDNVKTQLYNEHTYTTTHSTAINENFPHSMKIIPRVHLWSKKGGGLLKKLKSSGYS